MSDNKSNYVIRKNANGKEIKVQLYNKSASAIIPYAGGFVLVKRIGNPYSGYWALAGGKAEEGETPEQNCMREVYEETGLKVVPVLLIKTDTETGMYMDVECKYESSCFLVKVIGGELKKQDDECEDISVFTLEEAMAKKLAFKHNMMLEEFYKILQTCHLDR